jgi:hypothetical protein
MLDRKLTGTVAPLDGAHDASPDATLDPRPYLRYELGMIAAPGSVMGVPTGPTLSDQPSGKE